MPLFLLFLSLALCLFTLRLKFTHTHTGAHNSCALVCESVVGGHMQLSSIRRMLFGDWDLEIPNGTPKTFLLFSSQFFAYSSVNKNKYRKFVFHSGFLFAFPIFLSQQLVPPGFPLFNFLFPQRFSSAFSLSFDHLPLPFLVLFGYFRSRQNHRYFTYLYIFIEFAAKNLPTKKAAKSKEFQLKPNLNSCQMGFEGVG